MNCGFRLLKRLRDGLRRWGRWLFHLGLHECRKRKVFVGELERFDDLVGHCFWLDRLNRLWLGRSWWRLVEVLGQDGGGSGFAHESPSVVAEARVDAPAIEQARIIE